MAVARGGAGLVEIRGKLGTAVFQRFGDRLMMRTLVTPHDPKTREQVLSRMRMARVAALWKALSDGQFTAWETFAQTRTGGTYRVFMGLTMKWLQMNPNGTPPAMPPLGPFFGDAPTLALGPSPEGGLLTVDASQANAAGVVTEILVHPLAHVRRKPRGSDWRTAAFLGFTSSSLSRTVALSPGAYAVAYRFVKAGTGQASVMTVVGRTEVD